MLYSIPDSFRGAKFDGSLLKGVNRPLLGFGCYCGERPPRKGGIYSFVEESKFIKISCAVVVK
jgi:hypothetical protein